MIDFIDILPHLIVGRVNGGWLVRWQRHISCENGDATPTADRVYSEAEYSTMLEHIGEHLLLCGKPYEDAEEDIDDTSDSVNDALRQRPKG